MSSRYVLPFADVGNGIQPEDGAKLFFFEPDGVTPKDTFSDQLSTPTPNTNPVIADSNGVFGNIFITGEYKNTLKDKNDVQIFGGVVIKEFVELSNNAFVKNFDTLALLLADTGIVVNDAANLEERSTGKGGGAFWDAFPSGTFPVGATIFDVFDHDTLPLQLKLRRTNGIIFSKAFGLIGDNTADDTAAFVSISALSATGVPVIFEDGTYLIDEFTAISNMNIKSINGAKLTTLKLRTDTGTKLIVGEGVSNVTIKGFTVDPRKADFPVTVRTAIQLNFVTPGSNIDLDVEIPGSTSAGVIVDRTSGVKIKADVKDCVAGDGVRCSNSSDIQLDVRLTQMQNMLSTRRPLQLGSCTGVTGKFHIEDAALTFALDFGASTDMTLFGTVHRCLKYLDLEGQAKDITLTCAATGLDDGNGSGLGFAILENPSGSTASNITLNGSISGFFQGVRIEGGREITINAAIKECGGEGISIVNGALSSKRSQNIVINSSIVNCAKFSVGTRDGLFIDADKVTFNGVSNGTNHRFDIQTAATSTDVLIDAVTGSKGVLRNESFVYRELGSVRWFETAFNPEAFLTANPGSTCSRTTGQYYRKGSGTGNIGWIELI